MYHLVVVDDEFYIRESLRQVNWGLFGIELHSLCENGMDACRRIQDGNVDIVLTDIKMPIMDGIQLIEELKSNYPYIYIIVLSGYDDFEYVQFCLRNGTIDYILKPLNNEQLEKTFMQVVGRLEREHQQQLKLQILEKRANLAVGALRRSFLDRLLHIPLSTEEIEEESIYGEVLLDSERYTVLSIKFDKEFDKQDKDWKLIIYALEKKIRSFCEEHLLGYFWINNDTGNSYVLVTNPDAQLNSETLADVASGLKDEIYKIAGLLQRTVSCGIGITLPSPAGLYSSCEKADAAIIEHNEPDGIYFYPKYHVEYIPNMPLDPCKTKNKGCKIEDITPRGNLIVEQVITYLKGNYMRSITLEQISGKVYANPVYLSRLFKEVTGTNFVDYLTKLRIEKAKMLLKECGQKVYEVGELVGYENPRYFTRIFKKITGYTPFDYKNRCEEAE